jgi:hypothetical protein
LKQSVPRLAEDLMWPIKQAGNSASEPPTPTVRDAPPAIDVVTAARLGEWRRHIVQLIGALDLTGRRPDEGVAARIGRLSREGRIPRQIVAMMRTVTETRNLAEYESKVLSPTESQAVSAAYAAVKEWASTVDMPFGEGR